MPTVTENREKWTVHDWVRGGHEWSPAGTEAGTDLLWWRSIMPRLHAYLPAATLLEIAPGFGRWTSYLTPHAARLVAVDVTERCIEICRERFADRPGAEFHLNDGQSLPMVADDSVDLAFSFDSLVHVEAPQILAYLAELARVLRPGAHAFIHHSNLGAYADAAGQVPDWVTKRHWRAASMSAAIFRKAAREAGLTVVSQEVINWVGRGRKADRFRLEGDAVALTDCISVLRRTAGRRGTEETARVFVNRRFVDEWRELIVLATMYAGAGERTWPPPAASGRREHLRDWIDERRTAMRFRRREPIVRPLADGRCPDCAGALTGRDRLCARCGVTFAWN